MVPAGVHVDSNQGNPLEQRTDDGQVDAVAEGSHTVESFDNLAPNAAAGATASHKMVKSHIRPSPCFRLGCSNESLDETVGIRQLGWPGSKKSLV